MWTLAKWYVSNTWGKFSETAKILVVAALVVLVMATCQHSGKDPLIAEASKAKATISATLKANDSLLTVVVARDTTIVQLEGVVDSLSQTVKKIKVKNTVTLASVNREKHDADSLKTQTDSIALARTVIPKQDSIIAGLDSLFHNTDSSLKVQTSINATQKVEIGKLKDNEATLKTANGKLVTQVKKDSTTITDLQKGIEKHDKILGFIPMPSRKAVAAISSILTAIVLSR
jgi:hypothetical protein